MAGRTCQAKELIEIKKIKIFLVCLCTLTAHHGVRRYLHGPPIAGPAIVDTVDPFNARNQARRAR